MSETHYYPFGLAMNGAWYNDATTSATKYLYNGKELNDEFGLNLNDYGARWYDASIGRWWNVDPLAEKARRYSPYVYGNDNPIVNIDVKGGYAVSVHYAITYSAFLEAGYSKKEADLIAHYASTYADNPPSHAGFLDFTLHPTETSTHLKREGIDYSPTSESQDEKNSMWHSMMSDEEAKNGMTEQESLKRGLQFGWDSLFGSEGKDLGKMGQGFHALQDAMAHHGSRTSDHLGFNISSAKMLMNDMYGSTKEAEALTKTGVILIDLLKGNKPNLKDGDTLNTKGMTSEQLNTFNNKIIESGFEGRINFY